MSALTLDDARTPAINSQNYQKAFDKELSQRAKATAATTLVRSEFQASTYMSRAIAPTLGAYAFPAIVAAEGLQLAIPKIKELYYEKMTAAGLKLPEGVSAPTSGLVPTPAPTTAPIAPIKTPFVTSPPPEGGNLISVLQSNGKGLQSISESIAHSNTELLKGFEFLGANIVYANEKFQSSFVEKIEKLTESIKSIASASLLATDVNTSYKELELQNYANDRDVKQAYADLSLSNTVDISNTLAQMSVNVLPSVYSYDMAFHLGTIANRPVPEAPVINVPVAAAPTVNVNVPTAAAPTVNVNVPTAAAPTVNVSAAAPVINIPAAEAPVVNITVPTAAAPVVNVNTPDEITIKRSEAETALTNAKLDMTTKNLENHVTATDLLNKKLEHITFETTDFQADNLGDEIPSASPQKMRAIKDAVVAKKNSDENTFDVDEDDYEEMFPSMDWEALFTWNRESERLKEVVDNMGEVK